MSYREIDISRSIETRYGIVKPVFSALIMSTRSPSSSPPLIANDNAFLGEVFSRYVSPPLPPPYFSFVSVSRFPCSLFPFSPSESLSPTNPISAGFYRLDPGQELVCTYTYDEMKTVVDGEFETSDETGKVVKAGKGYVFFSFPGGARLRSGRRRAGWYGIVDSGRVCFCVSCGGGVFLSVGEVLLLTR